MCIREFGGTKTNILPLGKHQYPHYCKMDLFYEAKVPLSYYFSIADNDNPF